MSRVGWSTSQRANEEIGGLQVPPKGRQKKVKRVSAKRVQHGPQNKTPREAFSMDHGPKKQRATPSTRAVLDGKTTQTSGEPRKHRENVGKTTKTGRTPRKTLGTPQKTTQRNLGFQGFGSSPCARPCGPCPGAPEPQQRGGLPLPRPPARWVPDLSPASSLVGGVALPK